MTAQEVLDHLRSLNGGWVDPEKTVDTFKAGDPNAELTGIAVGWMSYSWALERAAELGCNLFVTHEPTYWDHLDNPSAAALARTAAAKRRWIEEHRMVILRCHDLWDQMPEIGIPDSWGAFLELGTPLVSDRFYRVYEVSGLTAGEIAARVAERVASYGQRVVQLSGDPAASVSRLALGTGAITPFIEMIERYEANIVVCSDDGSWTWRDGAYAIDSGIPLIRVNHAVSELPGIRNLAEHLAKAFPSTPVHHIRQQCMYTEVEA